jgi:mannosyltransferase
MNKRSKQVWVSVVILLVGASLRLGFIQTHGFDSDEIFTIGFVQRSLGFLISDFANTQYDVHPKLYYVLLHFWLSWAGISEISARFPSLAADILLGAILFESTRAVFGNRAGLIAGVLWCANPLLVWNTAQVRMYGLLAMWTALSWLFLIKALGTTRLKWWIGFGLSTLAAAYTHVLGGIVLVTAGFASGTVVIGRRRWSGLLIILGAFLAYLPYLIQLWAVRSIDKSLSTIIPRNPLEFASFFLVSLLVNRSSPPQAVTWVLATGVLLVLALSWRARRRVMAGTLLILTIITSLGAGYFALGEAVFGTKYIAFIVPAFLASMAGGMSMLRPPLIRGAALVGLLAASTAGLWYQMLPTITDDFPSAARFIEDYGDAGDTVIVMTNYAEPAFRYYYQGKSTIDAPWHTMPPDVQTEEIEHMLSGHDTAWLVLYATNTADPTNNLDNWFRARYPVRTEAFPTGATIRAYDLRPMTLTPPPEAAPLDAIFEGRVALRGYQIYQRAVTAHDERLHPPSGWVHVTLYWEALEPGVVFEARPQIENAMSELYGAAFTRGTEVTVMHPTTGWQPGQIWRTDYDINLNPAAPPGEYKIVVRVFSPGDTRPWTLSDGETSWVILDQVAVSQ